MLKTSLSYLLKIPQSPYFYFRMRVPFFLRRVVIRKEFRYSLRTSDTVEAQYLAAKIAQGIKSAFRSMQRRSYHLRELTTKEIENFVYREIRRVLAFQEEDRANWLKI